jgi:hypothetical protein
MDRHGEKLASILGPGGNYARLYGREMGRIKSAILCLQLGCMWFGDSHPRIKSTILRWQLVCMWFGVSRPRVQFIPDSKILVRSNPDSKIATPSLSMASLVGPGMRHGFLKLEAGENYSMSKDFNYRDAWILSQIMMTSGLRGESGFVLWFSVGQVIVKR